MSSHLRQHLLFPLTVIIGLTGMCVALGSRAGADGVATTNSLTRDLEPVIVTGQTVSALMQSPTDELFVYAYTGGAWEPVPYQVDEVTATGAYTITEDGLLDANDEIVFMARDLGDQALPGAPITMTVPSITGWYEIEVTNPVSPTEKGWASVVRSPGLRPAPVGDYVYFDPLTHRLNGQSYSLGFATPNAYADYLTLGSGADILDRTKFRLLCQRKLGDPRTWLCPIDENESLPIEDDLVKDGPVRTILRGGRVVAYGFMANWTTIINIPSYLEGDMRFSLDFNEQASGALFYNADVPSGVTVDGTPDSVPATPLSSWLQLSTAAGTLLQVSDTSSIGGTQTNYYADDATVDPADTGDQRRYGDSGVFIRDPNLSFTYTFSVYALPGSQPNVGSDYEAFFNNPLVVSARLIGDPRPVKVYLPLMLR